VVEQRRQQVDAGADYGLLARRLLQAAPQGQRQQRLNLRQRLAALSGRALLRERPEAVRPAACACAPPQRLPLPLLAERGNMWMGRSAPPSQAPNIKGCRVIWCSRAGSSGAPRGLQGTAGAQARCWSCATVYADAGELGQQPAALAWPAGLGKQVAQRHPRVQLLHPKW
jgi:hypothetical protein